MKELRLILLGSLFISSTFINVIYSQISIREIKAIYKSKIDGRIISEKEFQTYKGTHTFHKQIKGKHGVDTLIISPPNKKLVYDLNDKGALRALVGKSMKPFNVKDIYGNVYNSEDLKGKVIVLNFWFVACPPCIKEMPELNKIMNSCKDRDDIVFIAFAKDTEVLLGKFLSHTNFEYAVIPNSKSIAKTYGVNAYPSNLVIDKRGIVKYTSVGMKDNSIDELKSQIAKLLR